MTLKSSIERAFIGAGDVTSFDGSRISYIEIGSGPTIVIVHGSLNDGLDWSSVARLLQARHRVVMIDRRGYGRSDFGRSEYSMKTEVEDLAAVLDKVGPATVVGHSYGARVALEAALEPALSRIERLVVFEPAFSSIHPDKLAEAQNFTSRGEFEKALILLIDEMPAVDIPLSVRSNLRTWGRLVGFTANLIREANEINVIDADASRFGQIAIPVHAIVGEKSPEIAKLAASILSPVISDFRLSVIKGQDHAANVAAPDRIADLVSHP